MAQIEFWIRTEFFFKIDFSWVNQNRARAVGFESQLSQLANNNSLRHCKHRVYRRSVYPTFDKFS